MYHQQFTDMIEENRGWFMALGVLLIVLGAAAMALPHMMTLTTELLMGSVLVIAGVAQIIQALGKKKWGPVLMSLLIGILYTAAGVMIIANPIGGALALTVLLSAVFIAEGIVRFIMGIRFRPNAGAGWMMVAGLIGVLVGVMIAARLPTSAIWAIGLLVGINFFVSGWSLLFLSMIKQTSANSASPVLQK